MRYIGFPAVWALILALAGTTSEQARAEAEFKYGLYGAISARRHDVYRSVQDFNPKKRWSTDLDVLAFEAEVEFSPKLELEAELEVEHGGTGVTGEFDAFEEAGEFESDIEQGGEVKLENFTFTHKTFETFRLHGGFIRVPIGWQTLRHKPTQSFVVESLRAEGRVIPSSWHEVGVGAAGEIGELVHYEYAFVNALNSEFFRKYNFVGGSSRRRFESNFADSWAHALRIDAGSEKEHRLAGFSVYYGDGTGARQKPGRLTEPTNVLLADLHALYTWEGLRVRALFLRGYLQNAHLVGTANSSLSGVASAGGFASVGKEAEAAYLELGYDLATVLPSVFQNRFDVFGRVDYWDAMKAAPSNGLRDPRFRERAIIGGINAYLHRESVLFKAQYANVRSGLPDIPTDHQIALGLGFTYFPHEEEGEKL